MNRLPVPKKIAGVHSTTVPCEPNTANRHKEKPNIFEKSITVLTTLCMVGLELLAQGGNSYIKMAGMLVVEFQMNP